MNRGKKPFRRTETENDDCARIGSETEILILDDSASALDFATDAALRKSIKEMKTSRPYLSYLREQHLFSMQTRSLCWMMEQWQESEHMKNC